MMAPVRHPSLIALAAILLLAVRSEAWAQGAKESIPAAAVADKKAAQPAPAGASSSASAQSASTPDPISTPGDGEDLPRQKQPETFLEFAVAGGALMIPITLCSIVWIAYLVERLFALQRKKAVPPKIVRAVKDASSQHPLDRGALREKLNAHPSAAAAVVRAALDRLDLTRDEIEKSVNNAAQREIYLLRRNLRVFAIVSSVAPLLGLLGTVTGLVQSFREVAISGLGSGAALAPGIYQALITTVGGLVVAIPALLTYYWLMARVDHFVHEMDGMVVDFVDAQHVPLKPR